MKPTLCALIAAFSIAGMVGCGKEDPNTKQNSIHFLDRTIYQVLYDETEKVAALRNISSTPPECFYSPGQKSYCLGDSLYEMNPETYNVLLDCLEDSRVLRFRLDKDKIR